MYEYMYYNNNYIHLDVIILIICNIDTIISI